MSEEKYKQYQKLEQHNMILRDYLAIDRTLLANERSFLAYIRTALTLLIAGVTLIKFFGDGFTVVLGWSLIFFGTLVFLGGALRFETNENIIKRISGEIDEAHKHTSIRERTKRLVKISREAFKNFV